MIAMVSPLDNGEVMRAHGASIEFLASTTQTL
jgi:hypothetical protein